MHLLILEIKVLVSMVSTGCTSKTALDAGSCCNMLLRWTQHHARLPSMDTIIHLAPSLNLPNTIPHNAWTRVTSQKLLHLLRVLPATFLQNLMFPKKRPPTRIHKRSGESKRRNAEKFLATKGPSHDVIASNGPPNSHGFCIQKWSAQLLEATKANPSSVNAAVAGSEWPSPGCQVNPQFKSCKCWGGAHKNPINPCCGVCVEGLLHCYTWRFAWNVVLENHPRFLDTLDTSESFNPQAFILFNVKSEVILNFLLSSYARADGHATCATCATPMAIESHVWV